jgi:hypothetical protein
MIHSKRFRKVAAAVGRVAEKAEANSMLVLKDEDFDCFVFELLAPAPVIVGAGSKLISFSNVWLCRQSEAPRFKRPDGTFDPSWRTFLEDKLIETHAE